MKHKTLIEALTAFAANYEHLQMVFHDYGSDLPDGIFENYPFEKSFDEYSVNEWIEPVIRELKRAQKEECLRLLIKIINELEYREWEYDFLNGYIQIEIGNEHYKVHKQDFNGLKDLHDEITGW